MPNLNIIYNRKKVFFINIRKTLRKNIKIPAGLLYLRIKVPKIGALWNPIFAVIQIFTLLVKSNYPKS